MDEHAPLPPDPGGEKITKNTLDGKNARAYITTMTTMIESGGESGGAAKSAEISRDQGADDSDLVVVLVGVDSPRARKCPWCGAAEQRPGCCLSLADKYA